jgi:hypothetical protein
MAGDWIKIETTLPDKPEVVKMTTILAIDQDAVVGKLIRFWIWADANTADGHALSVTSAFIDRLTYCPGFADALSKVGWLEGRDAALSVPNFVRHNGQTAKSRAQSNDRQKKRRSDPTPTPEACNDNSVTSVTPLSRNERDKNVTREREKKKRVIKPPSPTLGRNLLPAEAALPAEEGGGGEEISEGGRRKAEEDAAEFRPEAESSRRNASINELWAGLLERLRRLGMGDARVPLEAAFRAGLMPQDVSRAVDHFEAHPLAWTLGYLWARIKQMRPGEDPITVPAWPPKSAEWQAAQKQAATPASPAKPTKTKQEAQSETKALLAAQEATLGVQLDALPEEVRQRVIQQCLQGNRFMLERVKTEKLPPGSMQRLVVLNYLEDHPEVLRISEGGGAKSEALLESSQ